MSSSENANETINNDVPRAYEALAALEAESSVADVELLKEQIRLYEPIYAKRSVAINSIPKFWPRVIEQVGYDIDQYITEVDARLLDSLVDFKVSRHDPAEPRNFTITMTFEPNEFLQDTTITKVFSLKSAKDPTLQSTKSIITWKPSNDLTKTQPGGAKSFFHFFNWTGEEKKTEELSQFEELAITMVEDIWPNAIKYYTESFEEESEEDENAEIDLEADDDDDDDDDVEEEDENLVDEVEPPLKKQKNGV